MVCVNCGNKTQIINSRLQRRNNNVWRRRQCTKCGAVFSTEETTLYDKVWLVIDKSGSYRPFQIDKLRMSLYESCKHRKSALNDSKALTDTIVSKLQKELKNGVINSNTITQVSRVALNRFDRAASVHYEVNHV